MNFILFFYVLATILLGVFLVTGYLCYLVRHSNGRAFLQRKKVKIMSVVGSGGHTTEMLELLKHMDDKVYTPRTYIIADTDEMSEDKVRRFESDRNGQEVAIEKVPRSREVGQSYPSSVVSTLYATYFCFFLVWKHKPDLLLLNGPGTCIPIAFMAALLDMVRITDTCIIYEESICRVETMSLSGAILYYAGLADEVIVQWPQLHEKYPRTKLVEDLPISTVDKSE